MELIYLWIENYKNIKQQGFNFSPRFTCQFFPEYEKTENGATALKNDCKLEIKENKDHVNIFPENINVTTIIGENGSGKSSILEAVEQVLSEDKTKIGFTYILVFKKDKLYLDTNIKSIEFKLDSSKINGGFKILSHSNLKKTDSIMSIKFENKPYKPNIIYCHNEKGMTNRSTFIEHFKTINLKFDKPFSYIKGDFIFTHHYFYIRWLFENDKQELENIEDKEKIQRFIAKKHFDKIVNKNPILCNGIKGIEFDLSSEEQEICNKIIKMKEKIEDSGTGYKEILNFCQEIKNLIENMLEKENKKFEVEIIKESDFKIFLEDFYYDKKHREWRTENKKINKDVNGKIYDYLHKWRLIGEDFINIKNDEFRYKDLSSGEKQIITLLTDIIYKAKPNKCNLVLLDEPEAFLHPNLQKQLIFILLNTIKKLKLDNIHIIVTSHSPFILPDIPKENVIFLQDGKQVYPDINTFGANIHTLLSHGFFMKDGLMGDFAKEKINEIIRYLNGENITAISDNNEAQKRIDTIGEPILRKQLQKMIDSKRLEKVDKIDKIEKEIERLSDELSRLQND